VVLGRTARTLASWRYVVDDWYCVLEASTVS